MLKAKWKSSTTKLTGARNGICDRRMFRFQKKIGCPSECSEDEQMIIRMTTSTIVSILSYMSEQFMTQQSEELGYEIEQVQAKFFRGSTKFTEIFMLRPASSYY